MKLSEAMKKATPGPFGANWSSQTGNEPKNGWHITGRNPDLQLICDMEEENLIGGKLTSRANAALLAHWYNTGPKLLNTLKTMLKKGDIQNLTVQDIVEAIVSRAEEVEGI